MPAKAKISGSVESGFPSSAEQYQEPPLDLNELLVKRPAATYFVRVEVERWLRIRRGWRGGSEAVERKSERMDTAYSPRLHEEELSATASRILLRVVELWLENIGCGMVESESFLDSTRRMVEAWLGYGWSGCWMVGEMVV